MWCSCSVLLAGVIHKVHGWGTEQSHERTRSRRRFLCPQEWDLSMQTSCISLYVLRAEQRQLYFWLYLWFFSPLLICFIHSVFILFILYSVGEMVVDTCVLEFTFILRQTQCVCTREARGKLGLNVALVVWTALLPGSGQCWNTRETPCLQGETVLSSKGREQAAGS